MRMSGESQRAVILGTRLSEYLATPMSRVMGEDNAEGLVGSFQSFGEITPADNAMDAHTLVFAAHDSDAVIAPMDEQVVVEQQFPSQFIMLHACQSLHSVSPFSLGSHALVRHIVVVSEDAYHAVLRFQLFQLRNARRQFRFIDGDKVAGEADKVRLQGVYIIDNGEQYVLFSGITVKVQVGDMHYPVALEALRQSLARYLHLLCLMEIASEEVAVGEEAEP